MSPVLYRAHSISVKSDPVVVIVFDIICNVLIQFFNRGVLFKIERFGF